MPVNRGIHHLGLATHDMEATLDFYERVLGFETKVTDLMQPEGGGAIRHAFLDAGDGELIAFMECNEVPGISDDFDAGINKGLGIRGGIMHFAFKADDENDLEARRDDLREKGVTCTDPVDHGWCKSIYFRDPNDLQLEFCCLTDGYEPALLNDRDGDGWKSLSRVS